MGPFGWFMQSDRHLQDYNSEYRQLGILYNALRRRYDAIQQVHQQSNCQLQELKDQYAKAQKQASTSRTRNAFIREQLRSSRQRARSLLQRMRGMEAVKEQLQQQLNKLAAHAEAALSELASEQQHNKELSAAAHEQRSQLTAQQQELQTASLKTHTLQQQLANLLQLQGQMVAESKQEQATWTAAQQGWQQQLDQQQQDKMHLERHNALLQEQLLQEQQHHQHCQAQWQQQQQEFQQRHTDNAALLQHNTTLKGQLNCTGQQLQQSQQHNQQLQHDLHAEQQASEQLNSKLTAARQQVALLESELGNTTQQHATTAQDLQQSQDLCNQLQQTLAVERQIHAQLASKLTLAEGQVKHLTHNLHRQQQQPQSAVGQVSGSSGCVAALTTPGMPAIQKSPITSAGSADTYQPAVTPVASSMAVSSLSNAAPTAVRMVPADCIKQPPFGVLAQICCSTVTPTQQLAVTRIGLLQQQQQQLSAPVLSYAACAAGHKSEGPESTLNSSIGTTNNHSNAGSNSRQPSSHSHSSACDNSQRHACTSIQQEAVAVTAPRTPTAKCATPGPSKKHSKGHRPPAAVFSTTHPTIIPDSTTAAAAPPPPPPPSSTPQEHFSAARSTPTSGIGTVSLDVLAGMLLGCGLGHFVPQLVCNRPAFEALQQVLRQPDLMAMEQGVVPAQVSELVRSFAGQNSSASRRVPCRQLSEQEFQRLMRLAGPVLQPNQQLNAYSGRVLLANATSSVCCVNSMMQCMLVMAAGSVLLEAPAGTLGTFCHAVRQLLHSVVYHQPAAPWETAASNRGRRQGRKGGSKGTHSSNSSSTGGGADLELIQPTVSSLDVKAALIKVLNQGQGKNQLRVDAYLSPDMVVEGLRADCQQRGGPASSAVLGSMTTYVADAEGQLLQLSDVWALDMEALHNARNVEEAVPKLLWDSLAAAYTSGRMTCHPGSVSLVRGPADLLIHVNQQTGPGACGELLDKVAENPLPQQVDLAAVFAKDGGSRVSSVDDRYELRCFCASTWPATGHIVAFVKTARCGWVLTNDDKRPQVLGHCWADVATCLKGSSQQGKTGRGRGYQPTLLVYGRISL